MFGELLCSLGADEEDQNKTAQGLCDCGSAVIKFSILHKPNSVLGQSFISFKPGIGAVFLTFMVG